ncbi:hypothetical protein PMI14_03602 [Acidovorax sp. CF316]|uniref:hypothetical protein n=1 Tax=Acidovorax sp. CF316 TaxID=1144317 RepID=UPI00026BD3C3|nr:hypothetical protein [Acidovorax sp. CF316]EJE51740.1 hypothetical protein PMI14_03602 [Acidovorax sp. CF316]
MRRGPLFYLLMVVLVLRGLVGTAMAAGMVPMQHPAPAAVAQAAAADHHGQHDHAAAGEAAHAGDHGSSMQGGHHAATEAATLACDGSTPGSTGCATHHQHANCTACEICHTALMEPPAMPAAPLPLVAGAAPAAATPFDSATAALAIKPPIA